MCTYFSVMLAAKFFDDQYYNNKYYAKVGGITPSEMNTLEVEFLFMAKFSLFVSSDTYSKYYLELQSYLSHGQCKHNPETPLYMISPSLSSMSASQP